MLQVIIHMTISCSYIFLWLCFLFFFFFFQAEDGIRDVERSRGLGDVYKRQVLYMAGYEKATGILMDIGVSSKQFDNPERGFSYRFDAKLDMRMDKENPISAYEIINEYPEEKLSKIIFEYGEERFARKIAAAIVRSRESKKIETTFELVDIIRRAKKNKNFETSGKTNISSITYRSKQRIGSA
eukprot:TRINITY_DN64876_c0_g1_i2.p3 TRINITY_DN64876_c0_g1~~TRINITY_DN64876_c0_g1_i2.p3  ORF type:complete len:184 (+),score=28.08 TRINITY_DN64876_c0_g1_i2:47-598(+)